MDSRIDKQIDSLVAALTDPIIVFPGGWEDTLPDRLKGEIKIQRLVQLMKEEETATDAEACVYLYTASLTTPVNSDWTEIYCYLVTKLKSNAVPEDISIESLSDYRAGLLQELKDWIWDRRQKYKEVRHRAERARAKTEAGAKPPVQLKLGL